MRLGGLVVNALEPQAQGNLMRHPMEKQHMSKNSGVKRLIEDLDHVPPHGNTFSQRASLFIFEDSDAVINMTMKP